MTGLFKYLSIGRNECELYIKFTFLFLFLFLSCMDIITCQFLSIQNVGPPPFTITYHHSP